MLETKCILHLQNGNKQEGKLTILFETGHEINKFVEFSINNVKQKISLDSIESYEIDGNFYYPKILDIDFNGSEKFLFVKRLSNENSRMQLYELYQKKKQNSDPSDFYYYFLSFPNRDIKRPVNLASKQITPNFDEKMSKLLKDCPVLSNKVENKKKGYFFSQYSLGNYKKTEVLLRIINEYDSCK